MFHVERIARNTIVKGIILSLLLIFTLNSCVRIKSNPEIADYHILNSVDSREVTKNRQAVFVFENHRPQNAFQRFLGIKLEQRSENRDFKVKIQNQSFVISVLDNIETEKLFTIEDFVLNRKEKGILKNGQQQGYIVISVTDKMGNDCLKNSSLYQNLVVTYLKELKLEYSVH